MTNRSVDFMLRSGCEITRQAIEDAQPNPFIRRMRLGQSLDFSKAYEVAEGRTTLNSALRRIGYKFVKAGAAYTLIDFKKDVYPVTFGSFDEVKANIYKMIFGTDEIDADDYYYIDESDDDDCCDEQRPSPLSGVFDAA